MNYELVIATTTYFNPYIHVEDGEYRRGLWKLFMDSLLESNLDGHKIALLVSDDGSSEPPKHRFCPFDVHFRYFRKNRGYIPNMVDNLNFASSFAPLVLSVDSDAYFHPHWLKGLCDLMEIYSGEAGWCLFNSPYHREEEREISPGILTKINTQLHGLCYRAADREPCPLTEYVEGFIVRLMKHDRKFVFPKISLIQHTGAKGINNIPNITHDFDPLFPYNKECGLEVAT